MTFTADHMGSSQWATLYDVHRAGLLKSTILTPQGVYCGEFGSQAMHHTAPGPHLQIGGARSGKLVSSLSFQACLSPEKVVFLDPRGEIAKISLDSQSLMRKGGYVINPLGLHDLPRHSVDLTCFMKRGSLSLTSDIKTMVEALIATSGKDDNFFEMRARAWAEIFLRDDAEEHGSVSLNRVFKRLSLVQIKDSPEWEKLARRMASRGPEFKQIVMEILNLQASESRAFGAICAELNNGFAFMSDPAIRDTMSDNPDLDLEKYVETWRSANIYVVVPVEQLRVWAPFMKMFMTALMIVKGRMPSAPTINLTVDEAGQLGYSDFLLRAFTYGAGMGLKCRAVFQDTGLIKQHYQDHGISTLVGSAQVFHLMGIRDLETARLISSMVGETTREYYDDKRIGTAEHEFLQAVYGTVLGGDNIIMGMMEAQHRRKLARTPDWIKRLLIDPAEILRLGEREQILLVSGSGCPPIRSHRVDYFRRPDMAGKYFEHPFHGRNGEIKIMGHFGMRKRSIIETIPPQDLMDLPQFKSGRPLRYVEGYAPWWV